MVKLTVEEIAALRDAQGAPADGGETNPALWELEQRGLVRPTHSYNPNHYLVDVEGEDGQSYTFYDFTEPVYVYTRTLIGEEVNAFYNPPVHVRATDA